MLDASAVPPSPLYSLVISPTGDGLVLTLDGQVLVSGADLGELRAAGRDKLIILAALAGRPIRARATEPDSPAPWCMIVTPDGGVHDVPSHPAPPPPPPRPAAPPSVPPTPPLVGPPATLVPEVHRETWAALWAAHTAGDLPTAVRLAHRLEAELENAHGPRHPYTITALTARAWLTLCQRTDPAATAELLITTALRRHVASARPETDTRRAARNAHALWWWLRRSDPGAACDIADRLVEALAAVGERGLVDHVRQHSTVRAG
ncbi:hypothetical protein AB0940_33580 [Streptomyces sp. NPDC006656]|uniref:hypothetical protein n=1 Tax=Streptomyces sp. NPDC006656 TaxID=3156899 RepID=UPI003456717E